MWKDFLYTIRQQELGANAFHSLSLRLATSGDSDQALINAEKATELYRELVGLAPRHLPTLASSLWNLASILWYVDRQEAVAVCKEAVNILRKVVDPETYFLPALAEALDQVARYFTETGDNEGASAPTAESQEFRRKFALLPPQPDSLFEEVEMDTDLDDEGDKDIGEAWETTSKADEEDYHASMAVADTEGVGTAVDTLIMSVQRLLRRVDFSWILVAILSVLVGVLSVGRVE
ncbi:hypothetical protein B0H19DRAFT_1247257 [Mycena capillaripes]|nr:hypothetical protein B0H19DRAFT_1247257 [Mycena capillaripes]